MAHAILANSGSSGNRALVVLLIVIVKVKAVKLMLLVVTYIYITEHCQRYHGACHPG